MNISLYDTLIFAGGEVRDYSFCAPLLKSSPKIYAADGGLRHCAALNITPSLIIGDNDSTPESLLKSFRAIPLEVHAQDKDKSDTDLAVERAITDQARKIGVIGALGGRTDHLISNLNLTLCYPKRVYLLGEHEVIFGISGKNTISCFPNQTISLFPIGDIVQNVTTRGLKWELDHRTLDFRFFSLSNVSLESSFDVNIPVGNLVCIMQTL